MGLEIKLEKVSKNVLCYQVYRQDDHKKSVNHKFPVQCDGNAINVCD